MSGEIRYDLMADALQCMEYKFYTMNSISLMVVTKCPPGASEEVKQACAAIPPFPATVYDYVHNFLPLISQDHWILFKNKACMECHGVGNASKRVLQPDIVCKYGLAVDIDDDVSMKILDERCSISLVRQKFINLWSCPSNECAYRNIDVLIRLCHQYHSPVALGMLRFRNPFCAKCDEVLNVNITCPDLSRNVLRSHHYKIPRSVGMLFKPDWEFNTEPNDRIYELRIQFEFMSHIRDAPARNDLMLDLLNRRIVRYSRGYLQHFEDNPVKLDCQRMICVDHERKMVGVYHSRYWKPDVVDSFIVATRMKIYLKKYKASNSFAAFIFALITPNGIVLRNRNFNVTRTVSSIRPWEDLHLQSCGGEPLRYEHSEFQVGVDGANVEYVILIRTGKRYRTDSKHVQLVYTINATQVDHLQRMVLYVCELRMPYTWLTVTTSLLTLISIAGLTFVTLTYYKFDSARNLPGKILLHISFSMAVSLTIWILLIDYTKHAVLCAGVAILGHYFWLSAFLWMGVMGFDTWRTFRTDALLTDKSTQNALYFGYCLFAWGISLVVVGAGVMITFGFPKLNFGYGSYDMCWLINSLQLVTTFLLPIGIVVLCNLLFLLATLWNILYTRRQNKMVTQNDSKTLQLLPFLKLPVFLGLSWLLGFLASVFQNKYLWVVFDLVNSSQGIILFLVFISNRRIRSLYGWTKSQQNSRTTKSMSSVN